MMRCAQETRHRKRQEERKKERKRESAQKRGNEKEATPPLKKHTHTFSLCLCLSHTLSLTQKRLSVLPEGSERGSEEGVDTNRKYPQSEGETPAPPEAGAEGNHGDQLCAHRAHVETNQSSLRARSQRPPTLDADYTPPVSGSVPWVVDADDLSGGNGGVAGRGGGGDPPPHQDEIEKLADESIKRQWVGKSCCMLLCGTCIVANVCARIPTRTTPYRSAPRPFRLWLIGGFKRPLALSPVACARHLCTCIPPQITSR